MKENSPSDSLNPAVGPHMDLAIQHNLLQGFGVKLNDRVIRIARINTGGVAGIVPLAVARPGGQRAEPLLGPASAGDESKARQQRAGERAEVLLDDTQKEIAAGAIPRVELPRAEAEVATRRQDLVIAQANVRQRESALKELLVRTQDPALEAAEIVPLDRIEDSRHGRSAAAAAAGGDGDGEAARRGGVEVPRPDGGDRPCGTENPLLPTLQVTAQTYNRGVAGTPQASSGVAPNPYFVGGYGTALGQVFRRNFPNDSAGVTFFGVAREPAGAGRLRDRPVAVPAIAGHRRSATSTTSWWTSRPA